MILDYGPVKARRALIPMLLWIYILFLALHLGADGWSFSNVFLRGRHHTVQFPRGTSNATVHHHFMNLAVEQAREAARQGEVPIGALVVRDVTATVNNDNRKNDESNSNSSNNMLHFEILASQHNRVETLYDAAAHAELLALRSAAHSGKNWRLLHTTLYSTLEPCPLCLSAAQAFRVSHVVYGAPDLRLGAVTTHMSLLDVAQHPFHNITTVTAGVRQEECGDLLRNFFRERRRKQSSSKHPQLQQPKEGASSISKRSRLLFWHRRPID